MKKIVFLAASQPLVNQLWKPKAEGQADSYGFEVEVVLNEDLETPRAQKALNACDALITSWGSPVCTADFLQQNAPNAAIIGHAAGSVAAISNESTYSTGIKVISANPVMAQAVAEWSLLATLLAARNFGAYTAWHGQSIMDFANPFNMSDIQNMTIGLWGFGDTSKHLLKLLAPLKPERILVASEHSSADKIAFFGGEKASFETVLTESDMVHALVGLNKANFERLGDQEFALLKDGATFINCGRANLANEAALLNALQSKRISAILDVFHQEPLSAESPFYQLDNVIMTPHNAGFPGRDRFIPHLFNEFKRFFDDGELNSAISKERFLTMTNEKLKSTA